MFVYLITHAHTRQVRALAAEHWQLSAEGQRQSEVLAGAPFWAEIDQVVVSAEPKTLLTVCSVVAARNLPVWTDCRLDEVRRAGWVEDYAAQVARAFANPSISIEGWEPVALAQQRALAALADLQGRFADKTLALVGHGMLLSLVRAYFLGHPQVVLDDWQALGFASYALVDLAQQRVLQDFPRQRTRQRS